MNHSHEVFVLLIINLIKKKEDKIISCKNCEINTQFLSNSDLFNFILEKSADIQNLYLFMCVMLEKHVKDSSKMTSLLTMLMKKFVVVIDRFFDFNSLQKVVVMIIEM